MTYDELVTAIGRYSNTDDPESFNVAIPGFISFAEDRISKELDIDAEISNQRTTVLIPAGQFIITKPPAFKGAIQFRVALNPSSEWTFLQMRTRSYCDDYSPARSHTGAPRYYCIYDSNNLLIVPTLDNAYYGELEFKIYISGLSLTAQTTWISINAPELLFEACMCKVAEFQKQPERAKVHEDNYQRALASEKIQSLRRLLDSLRIS